MKEQQIPDLPYSDYQIMACRQLDRLLKCKRSMLFTYGDRDKFEWNDIDEEKCEMVTHSFWTKDFLCGVDEMILARYQDLAFNLQIDPVTHIRFKTVNNIGKELADSIVEQNKSHI